MNLGQAVAVCLYELARNPKVAPPTAKPPVLLAATTDDLERLTAAILDGFRATGFLKSPAPGQWQPDSPPSESHHSTATLEEKTRRLVRRLNLSAADAELLLGLLRNLLLRLRP
jgi:tRNA/rRNA methyltransferase